jgi:predicted alpha-1,2-mannosidase
MMAVTRFVRALPQRFAPFGLLALVLPVFLTCCGPASEKATVDPLLLVKPLMGSDSDFSLSNGNTYPAIAQPWGMNFWTPQTGKMGSGWIYTYQDRVIRGIRQTHQPSPWINDYGAFSIMAVTGGVRVDEESRASIFSHKTERVMPHYYRVVLSEWDVEAEVTATERAAQFRFTFPEADSSFIVIDAFDMGSFVRIDPGGRRIEGYARNNHGGVPMNFRNYFVVECDKPFSYHAVWSAEAGLEVGGAEKESGHVAAVIGFKTGQNEAVHLRVASSFISSEQALINLNRELGEDDFETTRSKSAERWRAELSRIEIEGGTPGQQETFYSCLYRTLLFPRSFYEYDAEGRIVHYSPYNGEVLPGYMFTDNGFWDTFRAVFPFFNLMYREQNVRFMEGLVNAYKESGWLPEWASPGHRDCMIGSNSASLIADAWLSGLRGFDVETLYQGILKNTTSMGPVSSVGRFGAEYYNDLGYVPYDVGIRENAARTLEYAYADFCIARLAEALGKPSGEQEKYYARAMNYQNLFDAETRLMRGRNADGRFQSPFSPFKWGDAFTEGNSWHYTWSVFQDVQGLIDLMGGEKSFVSMLDSVFVLPPVYDDSYYGFRIHEILEMQIVNLGQYAHGNQPVQHMIYLYNYAGEPWKAQYWLRRVMEKLYRPAPDGYCGDEDNGQTSAWYVFSAMGFYPVCPGSGEYVLGSPLFNKVRLKLENGRTFEVKALYNSPERMYIAEARLNRRLYSRNYLNQADVLNGGKLEFLMDTRPNTQRGTSPGDRPFSLSVSRETD